MAKPTVGVFFGSRSPEHDISIITGEFVIAELRKAGYPVVPIYIGKNGAWHIADGLGSLKFFTSGKLEDKLESKFSKFYLDLEASREKIVFKQKGIAGKTIPIDVAFPALHGSFGEDGTIQGLFEMLGVPYVGCDVASSAIAMDKVLTKLYYQAMNIPTTRFVYFTKSEWAADKASILKRISDDLAYPLFVKPARLGSSIGIAKIKGQAAKDLEFRIEVALHYDEKVLVEEGVESVMDITCAVLGNPPDITTSLLQESVFVSDLFDFEGKYLQDGGAQLGKAANNIVIPARLDADITKNIQETARRIYNDLGCSGIARVDFLYNRQTKQFFANEINPLPGTLYHHLWKVSGLEISAILERLIAFAQQKNRQNQQRKLSFESSVLQQAGSLKLKQKLDS